MPEITKKLTKLANALDKLATHLQKDIGEVLSAGKEIKDSLPKGKPDNEQHEQ